MPEGLVGGILGDDEDRPEVEAPAALAGAEAFALAISAIASRQDPGVARKTEVFLDKQAHLLEIQAEHLIDEHKLRLKSLKDALREDGIRRFGLRLRAAFQVFVALVATVVSLGVLVMLRDAFTSRRVVIAPFHAPPALAARGIDGSVIANGLLDELSRLQDATRSTSAAYNLGSAWADNIKVDVAETGISLGELSRLLRERFGHDVHIEGDLIETESGGYAFTVRGHGVPPMTFTGAGAELTKLTGEAAAYVYSKSQPARWASYLSNTGRDAEAIEFARTAVAGADPATRAELLNTWANAMENTGSPAQEALPLYIEAIRIAPRTWRSYANLMNTYMILGQEEEAWRTGEAMLKVAGGRPSAPEDASNLANWDYLTWNLQAWRDAYVADAASNAGLGTAVATAGPTIADIQMRLHEPQAAELSLKTTKADSNDPTIGAVTHFVRGRMAADSGDVAAALAHMNAFATAYANPVVSTNNPGFNCWIAPAEEAAGHPDKADAVLKTAGTYVDCYRFRADILDERGNWPAAQKAYADAVALAPDLPAAYYSWGVALARHGDLPGAVTKLQAAYQRGPHWADPLNAWGDVLMKRGQGKEALAKYDEALKYAPNWAALKQAREAAAKHMSRSPLAATNCDDYLQMNCPREP